MKPASILPFLAICFFLILGNPPVHAQSWQWAKHAGSTMLDAGGSMCFDGNGNLYTTGNFSFPYGVFGTDTIATLGFQDQDVFITKMDPSGNYLWIKRAGSSGSADDASDILYEETDNTIVISGKMNGGNGVVVNCGMDIGDQVFLSKLDLNGNCIWSIGTALQGNANTISICHDDSGNIYMIGNTLYPFFFNTMVIQPGGFIARFRSSDGSLVWVKRVSDLSGKLCQIKYFSNNLYLGGLSISNILKLDTVTVNCNKRDPFISKFDTSGNITWVKTMGGKLDDMGGAIGLDNFGNIYTTGDFQDTAFFDKLMLTNGNKRVWYLTKYDNNGNALWARQGHITGNTLYFGVNSVNPEGDVSAVGTYSGTATFGNYSLIANSPNELFITKYNKDGICMGVASASNTFHGGLVNDHVGNAYVSGSFQNSAKFGNQTLTSYGNYDVFFAKHDAITGVHEPLDKPQNQLTIYANPTTGKCTITTPDELLHEKQLTLQLFDMQGKLIQSSLVVVLEGKIKLNMEAEAKGVYQVSLGNGVKVYVGKVVVE